ncbi:hypothetical protein CXU09_09825 [Akkermansia muciniphila]|uniref:Uncharacterized protein n=1 Tax=Akkermansia muciniphila TaxID=239935 RepID=A0AAP8NKL6_9BACT|nr:hypothetical protein CXU09_09825 [Akkermansia muciniphila]
MEGGMIIKEILACIRGKEAFPREWEAGKRGRKPFRRVFLTPWRRKSLLLGFFFSGNEATLPP